MSASLKHKFSSAKADGPDATLLKPSDWNAEHDFTVSASSVYLGRHSTGAGAVEQLPIVNAGAGDDGTLWTAQQIQAAITAAIASIVPPVSVPTGGTVGWYSGVAPAGWIFVNGRTIGGPTSAANLAGNTYRDLYLFLWSGLPSPVMLTNTGAAATKGASATLDFNAGKRLTLPDECGRVSAGANNMGGVPSTNRLTTAGGGVDGDTLASVGGVQNKNHSHTGTTDTNTPLGSLGIVSGGPAVGDHTHAFTTANAQVQVVQPTIIKNVIIKL